MAIRRKKRAKPSVIAKFLRKIKNFIKKFGAWIIAFVNTLVGGITIYQFILQIPTPQENMIREMLPIEGIMPKIEVLTNSQLFRLILFASGIILFLVLSIKAIRVRKK